MNQSQDDLVRQKCWNGSVVVEVESEAEDSAHSASVLIHIHRHLYPFHLLERVVPILGTGQPTPRQKAWLSFKGTPLILSRPLGLSYDLLTYADRVHLQEQMDPPWRLSLHWSEGGRQQSLEECRASFLSRLKESDLVRFGSTSRTNGLRRIDIDRLWRGLSTSDYETHYTIAKELWNLPTSLTAAEAGPLSNKSPSPGSEQTSSTLTPSRTRTGTRRWPVRWVFWPDGHTVQEPITVEEKPLATLQEIAKSLFPMLWTGQGQCIVVMVIQGCRVPLEALMQWLVDCMADPDGWLSILVVPLESSSDDP